VSGEIRTGLGWDVHRLAAGRALMENTELSARDIAEKSMKIAGEICIYTNDKILIEELKSEPQANR